MPKESVLKRVLYLCALIALPVYAEPPATCLFPDSQRGDAPQWLCNAELPEWRYLAVGDKSHMPSISLQNRLAGQIAMKAVARELGREAVRTLQQLAGQPVQLDNQRFLKPMTLLGELAPVKVVDKRSSPRRHLYVLAGVPADGADAVLQQIMGQLLNDNEDELRKQIGADSLAALRAAVDAYATDEIQEIQ